MVAKNDLCHDRSLPNAFNRSRYQSAAAPAVEFTTVPVIIRARSETRKTAAFAVSEVLAGVFRKFRLAIPAIIWSLVTFILRAKTSIVCRITRLSVFAVVRSVTTLTPVGL